MADSQGLEEKYRNQLQEALKDMEKKHKIKQEEAEAVARTNTDSQLKQCRDEHSNELKNLHTQHHRQVIGYIRNILFCHSCLFSCIQIAVNVKICV